MITSFLYLCLYVWHLGLPGYLIVRLLAIRRGTFLLAIAFSYSLLLLNLLPMEWLRASLWTFVIAFNLQVALLLVANVVMVYRRIRLNDGTKGRKWRFGSLPAVITNDAWCHRNRWWPPLAIILGVVVYLTWAGPYLELPADPWQHIIRFLHVWHTCIESGHFERVWLRNENWTLLNCCMLQGSHWYILHALLCRMSGLAIVDLPAPLTVANTIVFCLAIYGFAMFLWSRQRISRSQKIQASLWTTGFTALWLGVNIFAYLRYYALAPAILNYVIYLAGVILILDYLRSRSWWGHALWLVPLLVMAMNVSHTQEAVFACFMGLGILVILEGQWIWTKIRYSEARNQKSPRRPVAGQVVPCGLAAAGEVRVLPVINMLKIHVFFVGGLIIFGLLLFYSLHKPMGGYSEFILRPLFHRDWLGQKWLIQPPLGQFFQVLTWWGVFVYGLFLLYAGLFKRQPFILAGMLMPCLIVFNPLTLAILSRWIPDLNAIYRFNYMIPLPFVAGFLAMRFSGQIKSLFVKSSPRAIPFPPSQNLWRTSRRGKLADRLCTTTNNSRCFCLVPLWAGGCLLGLFILLTPWEPLFGMKSSSRFYTLKPVTEGNDQRRWGDMIALLRKHPQVLILTDTTTSFLLWRMNVNATDGEWWIHPSAQGVDRLELLRRLDRRRDWWLVINRRNGDFSMNGARSGHWPGTALMSFSTAYPDDVNLFIKQHQELFKEIWSGDQVQVYNIVNSRLWE